MSPCYRCGSGNSQDVFLFEARDEKTGTLQFQCVTNPCLHCASELRNQIVDLMQAVKPPKPKMTSPPSSRADGEVSQAITLYGVEAELPPGCPMICINENGDACICDSEHGDVPRSLSTHRSAEVFAATAACRWRDIHEALIDGGSKDGIIESYQQVLNWQNIRRLAIKDQTHA